MSDGQGVSGAWRCFRAQRRWAADAGAPEPAAEKQHGADAPKVAASLLAADSWGLGDDAGWGDADDWGVGMSCGLDKAGRELGVERREHGADKACSNAADEAGTVGSAFAWGAEEQDESGKTSVHQTEDWGMGQSDADGRDLAAELHALQIKVQQKLETGAREMAVPAEAGVGGDLTEGGTGKKKTKRKKKGGGLNAGVSDFVPVMAGVFNAEKSGAVDADVEGLGGTLPCYTIYFDAEPEHKEEVIPVRVCAYA